MTNNRSKAPNTSSFTTKSSRTSDSGCSGTGNSVSTRLHQTPRTSETGRRAVDLASPGGLASRAGLALSNPHLVPRFSAADSTECTRRTDAGDNPRPRSSRYRSSKWRGVSCSRTVYVLQVTPMAPNQRSSGSATLPGWFVAPLVRRTSPGSSDGRATHS